jgi:hypothetical protein
VLGRVHVPGSCVYEVAIKVIDGPAHGEVLVACEKTEVTDTFLFHFDWSSLFSFAGASIVSRDCRA